jgi:DNA-binding XRE family transcriptional regulator
MRPPQGSNWLWDSRRTLAEVKRILKDPHHQQFDLYAEKLLARVPDAAVVLALMDEVAFCQRWPMLKRRLQRDRWLSNRVVLWQTLYERLLTKFQAQGIRIRTPQAVRVPPSRRHLAQHLRAIRLRLGYTQRDLAKRLGVIQQYVSKIERGYENISVDALTRFAAALGKRVVIHLR